MKRMNKEELKNAMRVAFRPKGMHRKTMLKIIEDEQTKKESQNEQRVNKRSSLWIHSLLHNR